MKLNMKEQSYKTQFLTHKHFLMKKIALKTTFEIYLLYIMIFYAIDVKYHSLIRLFR